MSRVCPQPHDAQLRPLPVVALQQHRGLIPRAVVHGQYFVGVRAVQCDVVHHLVQHGAKSFHEQGQHFRLIEHRDDDR